MKLFYISFTVFNSDTLEYSKARHFLMSSLSENEAINMVCDFMDQEYGYPVEGNFDVKEIQPDTGLMELKDTPNG